MITRTKHRTRRLAENIEGVERENDNTENHPPNLADSSPVFRQDEAERDTPLAVVHRHSSHSTPPTVILDPKLPAVNFPFGHLRGLSMQQQKLLSHFSCACSPFSSLKWAAA